MPQVSQSYGGEASRLPRRRDPLARLALLVGGVFAGIIIAGFVVALVASNSNEIVTINDAQEMLSLALQITEVDVPVEFKPHRAHTAKGMFFAADAVLWKTDNDDWLTLGKLGRPFDPIELHVDAAINELPLNRVPQMHMGFYSRTSNSIDVEIHGQTVTFEIIDLGEVSTTGETARTVKGTFPTPDGQTGVLVLESSGRTLTIEQITDLLNTIR